MKQSNGYIGLETALRLIQNENFIFRQNPTQTEFKVIRTDNAINCFKLNKTTATELKKKLSIIRLQIKITV